MPAHTKYPLASLPIGESVLLKEKKHFATYINKRGREMGKLFRTRRSGEFRKVTRIA